MPLSAGSTLTEVLTKLVEKGSSIEDAVTDIAELDLAISEFNEAQSIRIADLRIATKHLGAISWRSRRLALAMEENTIAVTADKNWAKLKVCKIEVIR